MKYSKFDVIVANFPFIEKIENAKARPAVVVSSDVYNAETGFVVIAMITSAKHSRLWGDIKISDHKISELHSGSIIRMKFANITQGAILHKLGKLSKADQKELEAKMRKIF
ncbi:MAG: type II toxin-antitoxin system PemK/MazF family toxin [Proteobacteria bacterium]|nr:type II toxin-antitoxin system PemK/MazF family toxin [Pseudomonadota bacterium]